MTVAWELVLICGSSRDDRYFFNEIPYFWHVFLCAELYPSCSCVCDNIGLSSVNWHSKNCTNCSLKMFKMYFNTIRKVNMVLYQTWWIEETCTKQCIIPIKYNTSLKGSWFLRWGQPYPLLGQFIQEILSELVMRLGHHLLNEIHSEEPTLWGEETLGYFLILSFGFNDSLSRLFELLPIHLIKHVL